MKSTIVLVALALGGCATNCCRPMTAAEQYDLEGVTNAGAAWGYAAGAPAYYAPAPSFTNCRYSRTFGMSCVSQ